MFEVSPAECRPDASAAPATGIGDRTPPTLITDPVNSYLLT